MSGNGISWAICKSAHRCRQITTPALHRSVFTGRMPFLPPNQQRQSTEGKALKVKTQNCTFPQFDRLSYYLLTVLRLESVEIVDIYYLSDNCRYFSVAVRLLWANKRLLVGTWQSTFCWEAKKGLYVHENSSWTWKSWYFLLCEYIF